MGIVAHCPHGHRVKVKDFLAGKKGICPTCGSRFRIPLANTASVADGAGAARPVAAVAAGVSLASPLTARMPAAPSAAEEPRLPAAITDVATAVWCIAIPGGQPSATMSGTDLFSWLTSGRVTGGELVWRSDWTDWRPVADVFPEHVPAEHRPPQAAW